MTDNAKLIAQSKAGRRFIAQMNFYNAGDYDRLRQFIHGSYYSLILMQNPIDRRILDFKTTRKLHGRLKVAEVESAEEYAISVIMETEKNDKKLRIQLKVDEEYPHPILYYSLLPVEQ